MKKAGIIVGIVAVIALAAGATIGLSRARQSGSAPSMPMQKNNITAANGMALKSSAFGEGDPIPSRFTCDGENVNPMLEVKGVPKGAKSLAFIVDDPDATNGRTWNHWLVWNVDPHTQYVSEDALPQGAVEGTTSFGKVRYGGPCPPPGSSAHRYQFKLYALDAELDVPEGAAKDAVLAAMDGHVLAETTLTGMYKRRS